MRKEPAKAPYAIDDVFGAKRMSVVLSPGFHARPHYPLICLRRQTGLIVRVRDARPGRLRLMPRALDLAHAPRPTRGE